MIPKSSSIGIFLVLLSATAGHGAPGDDICTKSLAPPSEQIWIVDKDIGPAYGATSSEVRARFDQILQAATRHNRHVSRARVTESNGDCTPGGTYSCITAAYGPPVDPTPDSQCYPEYYNGSQSLANGPGAYAGCNLGSCWIVLCPDGGSSSAYGDLESKTVELIVRHELGHAFGLKHINFVVPGSTPDICEQAPNETCNAGSVFTDGADGEVMASGTDANNNVCLDPAAQYSIGDSKGMRWMSPRTSPTYQYEQRRLYYLDYGGTTTSLSAPVGKYISGRVGIWKPRMDCSLNSFHLNDCGLVRSLRQSTPSGSNVVQVRRLNGATQNGWNSFSFVASIDETTSFEPDIALNSAGTEAWVVYAAAENANEVVVARVDIDPLSGGFGGTTVFRSGFTTQLPPRIAWAEHAEEPVLGVERGGSVTFYNLIGSYNWSPGDPPIVFDSVSVPVVGAESVTTDFDFDCGSSGFFKFCEGACRSIDVCGIFARNNNVVSREGRLQVYRFGLDDTPPPGFDNTWLPVDWDTAWTTASSTWERVNAVTGVTFEDDLTMHVEFSQMLVTATDATQTWYQRWTGGFATGPANSFHYQSDMQSCAMSYIGGSSIGAATPYGGHSIAYCKNCNGGSIEAVGWGREWSQGTFCW